MADSRTWPVLIGLLLCGWLLYRLAPVLTPFLIATLLAYLGDPLVDRLQRLRLKRTAAVAVVFGSMIVGGLLALLVLVPLLQHQVLLLIAKVPRMVELLRDGVLARLALLDAYGISIDVEAVRRALAANWTEISGFATRLLSGMSQSGRALLGWLAYLLLIPVVTFYLLRDWDALLRRLQDLLPRRIEPIATRIAGECDAVLAEFLRGQLTVMFALAVIYSLGLALVGVDLALIIGVLAGLVSFVPYLGVIVGVVVAGFAAFLEYRDVMHLIGVGAVFATGQMLEGMVLSPKLVGDRIGLHPVAVIFAVMAGGQVFGFIGVLLALPVAAVVVVLLRHVHRGYLDSELYS